MFYITPQQFFLIGLAPFLCANLALCVIKSTGGLRVSRFREAVKWLFCVYLLLAASLVFFPVHYDTSLEAPVFHRAQLQLMPFRTITQMFTMLAGAGVPGYIKWRTFGTNIGGNLMLTLPLGFFLPMLHPFFRRAGRVALTALLFSCVVETVQFVETCFDLAFGRATDIDDVLLNVLGALLGYLLLWALLNLFSRRRQSRKKGG